MFPKTESEVLDFILDPNSAVRWDAIRHGEALARLLDAGLIEEVGPSVCATYHVVPARFPAIYVATKELAYHVASVAVRSVLRFVIVCAVVAGAVIGVTTTLLVQWVM